MRIVRFLEARSHLKRVLDRVADDADYAVIVRRDAPSAPFGYEDDRDDDVRFD